MSSLQQQSVPKRLAEVHERSFSYSEREGREGSRTRMTLLRGVVDIPVVVAGRLPRQRFQGLLGVHCALQPARPADSLKGPFLGVLQPICHLMVRPKCFRLGRASPVGIFTRGFNVPSKAHTTSTMRRHRFYPQPINLTTAPHNPAHPLSRPLCTRTIADLGPTLCRVPSGLSLGIRARPPREPLCRKP